MTIHKNAMAYSATTLAASMMNLIFQFYYVKIFLNVYRISNYWFNVAQVIFLVWNAVNDPLFGYIQDVSSWTVMRKRRLAILYGAPIFALSFLLPWFPWNGLGLDGDWVVGLHLVVSLCLYDGLFTFVLLAHCSLFAEISTQEEGRQTVLKYSQVASLIASGALFISVLVYNSDESRMAYFQAVCVMVSILSWLLMRYTGNTVQVAVETAINDPCGNSNESKNEQVPVLTLFMQIMRQKSFVCFIIMNFFQVFHTTVNSNFFLIFAEQLIGPDVFPPIFRSVLAGSAFLLPQIFVLLSCPLLKRFGSYRVIMWSFYIKFVLAAVVYLSGPSHFFLLSFFFLIDKSLPDGCFCLFNLAVSDIIDDDMAKYHRKSPVSSMIFGTNALFTKPAQSLAPMMVVYILSQYGYQEAQSTAGTVSHGSPELTNAIFNVLCLVPLCLALIQIVVWQFYPLKHPAGKCSDNKVSCTVPKHSEM